MLDIVTIFILCGIGRHRGDDSLSVFFVFVAARSLLSYCDKDDRKKTDHKNDRKNNFLGFNRTKTFQELM